MLMLLSWQLSIRATAGPIIAACSVLAISFVWNVYLTAINPAEAFYLPVTRLWELMLGCVLALASSKLEACIFGKSLVGVTATNDGLLRNRTAWLGAAVLFLAVVAFERENTYPGWRAACPAFGGSSWPERRRGSIAGCSAIPCSSMSV
jgi:peptidoglycan/LPS O-acetylase OafA/YrhL